MQHTIISQNLKDIFERITTSPECQKFLRFLFGKIMYSPGQSNTLLERFGEEPLFDNATEESKEKSSDRQKQDARKQLASFMKELWSQVISDKFKLIPPIVRIFCQVL